jgi:hypothetical protein
MLLRAPDAVEDPIWDGALEPDEAVEEARRGNGLGRDVAAGDALDVRDLPIVSVGKPEVWNLAELYKPNALPVPLQARLGEVNFYLVRLACSFRPTPDRARIEWARFGVSLRPDDAGRLATAFDLHPLLVTKEVKRNVKVSLSPTLKFHEVEAGIGSAEFGVEYPELQPVISASGAGESEPSWDFSTAAGERVHGSKWMHLVVAASTKMTACDATIDLTADVVSSGFRIPLFGRPKQAGADPLTTRLWGRTDARDSAQ